MGRVERGLISFHPSPVYESASSGFLGDLEFMVLAYYVNSGLDSDYLSAIAKSVGADVRNVHHSIKKLVRRGFVERVRRGLYRITEAGKQAVHKLPVRRLSKLSRWTSVRNCDGTGGAAAVAKALPSGRPCYGGTFYDNVRYYVSGKPCRTRRDQLMRLEDLSVADSVSYCEVMHRVENLVVDGIVVVYTNPEDGYSARVEWRPPRGFVRRNGVASTVAISKGYLENAFRAIAVVLREELPGWRLARLFDWLSRLWAPAMQ